MTRHITAAATSWLEKILQGLLLVVLAMIVIHAPLSVFFSSQFPEYELLIKAWKEVLLLVGLLVGTVLVVLCRQYLKEIIEDKLLWIIGIYALLHIILVPFSSAPWPQVLGGLAIDLRYLLFFVLIYILMYLRPTFRRPALIAVAAGALLVLVFGLLQVFVLPKDVLAAIGYGATTIEPYLTIDQNDDYIRINSTLRGPNPLGAYVIVVALAAVAYLLQNMKLRRSVSAMAAGAIVVVSPAVLWASYSRSALGAAVVSLVVLLLIHYRHHLKVIPLLASAGALGLILISGLYVLRDTSFVQHVIVHRDPTDSNDTNSNEGHVASLIDGAQLAALQPLGAGIGSTGSASLLGDKPVIIENQYLFIAHEAGWLGVLLFMIILGSIGYRLWLFRDYWLAKAVLASGIGLSIIGILLPVWVDDTVSLVWWGLAAIALAAPHIGSKDPVVS